MRPVWLHPESGGDWVHFGTVAEAIKHLKTKGINVWPAQLIRAAEKGVSRSGWSLRFTAPDEDAAQPPGAPESHTAQLAPVNTFFTPTSALPSCGCCGDKLLGDIALYPWQGPEDIGRYPWHMPGIQQPRISADIPGICHGYLPISRGRYPSPNPNRKKLKMHLATEQNC